MPERTLRISVDERHKLVRAAVAHLREIAVLFKRAAEERCDLHQDRLLRLATGFERLIGPVERVAAVLQLSMRCRRFCQKP